MYRIFSLCILCIGLIVVTPDLADGHGHHVAFKPQNASYATPQQRTIVTEALAVGSVLVSLWSSVLSDRAIEIDISNRMKTSLNDPTWYVLHGHAAILPPFLINENDPSTKIQFHRKKNSAFGTEGAAAYQLTSPQGTLSLVFMWKVPQVDSLAFSVKVEKGPVTGEKLKILFEGKTATWYKPSELSTWQDGEEQGVKWKAAMGTRGITTLKIAVM